LKEKISTPVIDLSPIQTVLLIRDVLRPKRIVSVRGKQ